MIRIIAAIGKNRELGKDNRLLWNLSGDLRNFRAVTYGCTVVMGRKTFESIGKPLPGRRNIVVTRNSEFLAEGVEVVCSFDKAMEISQWDCFVIGGAEIYTHALPVAERIYLTLVDGEFEADTFFPEYGAEWVKVDEKYCTADESNDFDYTFVELEKCTF